MKLLTIIIILVFALQLNAQTSIFVKVTEKKMSLGIYPHKNFHFL